MRFLFVCLPAIWTISGQTIATQNITVYDNYKILQAISGRIETIEENVNSLVNAVSKIEQVFDCGKPTILEGQFVGNSTYAHAVMVAMCNEGYSIHGNEKITCTTDGVWTTMPVCKPVCKSPRVPNSRQYTEDREYPIGSEVIIQCNHGYETRKYFTNKMTCAGKDVWSENVICRPIDCGEPPEVYHGYFNEGYSTTVNTVLTLTCYYGLELVGAKPFYCNESGQWFGQQLCMRRVCVPVGDNTTECFFNYDNFVFENGREVGEVTYTDDEACLTKCLRIHEHVAFIEQYFMFCTCYKRTNREIAWRSRGKNTFIREKDISMLEYA